MNHSPAELDHLLLALEQWIISLLKIGNTPMVGGRAAEEKRLFEARQELVSQLLALREGKR